MPIQREAGRNPKESIPLEVGRNPCYERLLPEDNSGAMALRRLQGEWHGRLQEQLALRPLGRGLSLGLPLGLPLHDGWLGWLGHIDS